MKKINVLRIFRVNILGLEASFRYMVNVLIKYVAERHTTPCGSGQNGLSVATLLPLVGNILFHATGRLNSLPYL